MSKKKYIPSRNPDGTHNVEYTRNWREEHPIESRESNRKASRKYREEHRKEWNAYYSAYMREWYKRNKKIHYLRSIPSCIKIGIRKNANFEQTFSTILANLQSIGWSEDCEQHINHIVSLRFLVKVCPDLPSEVAFDSLNLELTSHAENCSASKREVNNRTLEIATKLEKKYKILKGLAKVVKKNIGKVI